MTPYSSPANIYFNPRPPQGGRREVFGKIFAVSSISIHALRREGDAALKPRLTVSESISIHALRREGDRNISESCSAAYCISIHALRREGDRNISESCSAAYCISIHALRREGDAGGINFAKRVSFQSTPSAGRAT